MTVYVEHARNLGAYQSVNSSAPLSTKTVRVLRLSHAVEDALECKAHQHLVEVDTLRFGNVEQARTDGGGDVWIGQVHPMLSR